MLQKLIVGELRKLVDRIDNGTCELTEEEAMQVLGIIAREPLSKDQACSYLNLSRSRFDELVKEGRLPKGRKRKGFKELVWYKSELIVLLKNTVH